MNTRNQIVGTYLVKIVIAALILAVGTFLYLRLDVSRGKAYSLNPQTREILRGVRENILVRVYASRDLPPEYANLDRSLNDLLKEYARVSRGKVRFEYVHGSGTDDLLKRAVSHNINPVPYNEAKESGAELRYIVFGATLESRGKIASLLMSPGMESKLEYQFTKLVGGLSEQNRPPVLVFTDTLNINNLRSYYPYEFNDLQLELVGNYKAIQTDLDSLPDFAPVMLCMGVLDSLNTTQLYHLDQYLMRGGKLVVAQDRIAYQILEQGIAVYENPSNLFKMFEHYGFTIQPNIVLDKECDKGRGQGMGEIVDYPFVPLLRGSDKIPYTKGFNEIYMNLASEVAPMPGSKLRFKPVLQTSGNSNTLVGPVFQLEQSIARAADKDFLTLPPITLAAEVSGNFQSYFPPDSPQAKADPNYKASNPAGQIIVFGDNELPLMIRTGEGYVVINAIDHLLGRQNMIDLRSRNPEASFLSPVVYMYKNKIDLANPQPLIKRLISVFQLVAMLVPLLLLGILGLILTYRRKAVKHFAPEEAPTLIPDEKEPTEEDTDGDD